MLPVCTRVKESRSIQRELHSCFDLLLHFPRGIQYISCLWLHCWVEACNHNDFESPAPTKRQAWLSSTRKLSIILKLSFLLLPVARVFLLAPNQRCWMHFNAWSPFCCSCNRMVWLASMDLISDLTKAIFLSTYRPVSLIINKKVQIVIFSHSDSILLSCMKYAENEDFHLFCHLGCLIVLPRGARGISNRFHTKGKFSVSKISVSSLSSTTWLIPSPFACLHFPLNSTSRLLGCTGRGLHSF